jgi:signal transduction histidine kinase
MKNFMSVRRGILLLALVTLAFIAAMIGVMLVTLRMSDDLAKRLDGVHSRFEVIAQLEGRTNNYAEQLAEVLLLGADQKPEFDIARNELRKAFEDLQRVTREEFSTIRSQDEMQRELSDVEMSARLSELYADIDKAADEVFALQDAGRKDRALEVFRKDVEYRLANDLENLIDVALVDERSEVSAARAEVSHKQQLLFIATLASALTALVAGAGLGFGLHRSIIKPVEALAAGANAIAQGRFDYRVPVTGNDEFAAVSRNFNDMATALDEQNKRINAARTHLEVEVQQRTRELRDANFRLSDLSSRRAQFLADVSHELRTPLTILRGEADVALRAPADRDADREALTRIRDHAKVMSKMLDQLMAFARSDSENQQPYPEPVSLEDMVEQVLQEGKVLAAPKDIMITAKVDAPRQKLVCDPAMIRQAILIGVDNAIKYSPPGSQIELSAHARDSSAEFAITDEGQGVDQEDLPRVFERFYRGGGSGEEQGLGIGLAIARNIVERHHGSIGLENAAGRGARLRISLPINGLSSS